MTHRIHDLLRVFRGDIRHLPKPVILTIVSFAIYNFGWGFADPFFSLFLAEFSDSYAVVGLFSTIFMATSMVLMIPTGDLLDRVRHSLLINFAKVIVCVVAILYFLAGLYNATPLLLMGLVLNGFTYPLVWAGTSATLRKYSDKSDAALVIGLYFTFRQLAWAIGLGLGLWLVAQFPIYYIFIPSFVMPLMSAAFGRGKKDPHDQPIGSALKDIIVRDKLVVRFLRDMKHFNLEMWWSYITFFFAYAIVTFAFTFLPLFAESIGFSLTEIGLLVLVMNIPFIFSFIFAEIADHSERIRNVVFGMAIPGIAMISLALWHEHHWQIFAAAFFLAAGYAIVAPSLSSVITVLTPKAYTGTSTALLELVLQLSTVLFAPVIGLVVDAYGWNWSFGLAAVLFLVVAVSSIAAMIVFRRRNNLYVVNHPDSKHGPYVL